jgi:hypothetical protein
MGGTAQSFILWLIVSTVSLESSRTALAYMK